MFLIDEITNILSSSIQNLQIKEDTDLVSITFDSLNLSLPKTRDTINEILDFINKRDSFCISVIIDDCDAILLNANVEYDNFKAECETAFSIKDEGSFVRFLIQINKTFTNNTLSIYFIDYFSSYLESLPFLGILHKFNEFFQKEKICFESQIDEINIKTYSLTFVYKNNIHNSSRINRKERIEKTRNLSFCELLSKYSFLPEDFHVLESDNRYSIIENIFHRIEQVLSVIFLFDIVEIKGNKFIYKLNGYKSIIQEVDLLNINLLSHNTYYKIYEWAYNEGNVIDKVGLTRNVLSLHINASDLLIDTSIIDSIQSNHKMYLRGNLKQYIEIRNKISEQLFEFKNKADKVVDGFVDNFKKTLISVVSFYASVIIIRVLSKNSSHSNIFTSEVFLLSIFFIIVAIFMLLASRWEVGQQIKRYEESYFNLKSRHLDLLDSRDINLILNNDKDFNDNLSYIKKKRSIYNKCWTGSILLLFLLSIILYQKEKIITFLNETICCIVSIFQ